MTPKTQTTPAPRPARDPQPRGVLCPFCGEVSPDVRQCRGCRAFLDPLSRQATQNEMGPWAIRDPAQPFRPGCSFETIRRLVERGKIGPMTVIRGPTTRQAWSFAGRTPSVANLLGLCHNCRKTASADDAECPSCGASFAPETDRQRLGLAPVHLLPGQASPEAIASAAVADRAERPSVTLPESRRPVGGGSGTRSPAPAEEPSRAMPGVTAGDPLVSAPARATLDSDSAALRARVARLRTMTLLLLLVAVALVATLAAAMLGVLRLPSANALPAARARAKEPAPVTASTPDPVQTHADEGRAAGAEPTEPGIEAVPPPGAEPDPEGPAIPAADRGDEPPGPVGASPSRSELLDAVIRAVVADPPDPETVRISAGALAGQESDSEAWREAARRRAVLQRPRRLP